MKIFSESDETARYLHRYLHGLIMKCSEELDDEKKIVVKKTICSMFKSIFYYSDSWNEWCEKVNFVLTLLKNLGVKNEKIIKQFSFFIKISQQDSVNHSELFKLLIDENEIQNKDSNLKEIARAINVAIIWSIYCHHFNMFNHLILFKILQPQYQLENELISVIIKHGALPMFLSYVPDYAIQQIQITQYDANEIKDLELLKFLIARGNIKKNTLNYLSLSTAVDQENLPLLLFLLNEVKVQGHSEDVYHPSSFYRAVESQNSEMLTALVKSGAYDLNKEFLSELEMLSSHMEHLRCRTKKLKKHAGSIILKNSSIQNILTLINVFGKDARYRQQMVVAINQTKEDEVNNIDMQIELDSFLSEIAKMPIASSQKKIIEKSAEGPRYHLLPRLFSEVSSQAEGKNIKDNQLEKCADPETRIRNRYS